LIQALRVIWASFLHPGRHVAAGSTTVPSSGPSGAYESGGSIGAPMSVDENGNPVPSYFDCIQQ
jgi:hypothetical protein